MTSGGEHPSPGTGLVDRAAVSLLYSKVLYSVGLQPDLHSGQGTVKIIFICVPGTLNFISNNTLTTLTNTCIIYCIVTDVYEVMKSLNLPWIKTPQGLWKIYNTLQENVTASQSQAILMMQKCIEKDTQGIWSKRILGRDSPISMVSLSQRAPSMYRPLEKQGQHHIKLSQCMSYLYIYNIARLYTNSRLCLHICKYMYIFSFYCKIYKCKKKIYKLN